MRGKWVFWMDSDDTIDKTNGRKLRELVEGPIELLPMAYVIQVHCPAAESEGHADVTIVDHVKLFRNLPQLRFEGRIHEQILPAVRKLNGQVAWTDVFVTHSGADQSPDGRRRKHERDLRLLQLDSQERPDHPFVLFNLGMTYGDMEQHVDAVAQLNRCLAVSHPTESHVRKAYALLASSLMQLERIEESAQICAAGLKIFPEDPELQFRAGLAAHRLHRLDDAIRAYRRALVGGSERFFSSRDRAITGYKVRHNLAMIYEDQGRHDLAELQWRKVIADAPGYRAGWRGLREALFRQGRFVSEEVVADCLATVPSMQAESALARFELSKAHGDLAQAQIAIEEGLSQNPDDLDLQRRHCQLLFEQGRDTEAERALKQLCHDDPEDGAGHCNLGTLYLRMGRASDAIAAYQRSLAIRPKHKMTREQLHIAQQLLTKRESASDRQLVECA